jgi:hypothetical protein
VALATGGDPRAFVELLSPSQRQIETLYLSLRRAEGVERGHPLLGGPAEAIVRGLVGEGVLVERDGRVACSERGFLLLDEILERLTAAAGIAGDVTHPAAWPGTERRDSFDNVLGPR